MGGNTINRTLYLFDNAHTGFRYFHILDGLRAARLCNGQWGKDVVHRSLTENVFHRDAGELPATIGVQPFLGFVRPYGANLGSGLIETA